MNIHSTSDITIRLAKNLINKNNNRNFGIFAGSIGIIGWIYIRQFILYKYLIMLKKMKLELQHKVFVAPKSTQKKQKLKKVMYLPGILNYNLVKALFILNLFYTIQICKFFSNALHPDFFKKDFKDCIGESRNFSNLKKKTNKYLPNKI